MEEQYNIGSSKIQSRLCMAMSWLVLSLVLTNIGLGVEENFGIPQKAISLCLKLVTVFVFAWALWRPIAVSPAPAIFASVAVGSVVFLSGLLQPDNVYFAENVITFFAFTFPIIIVSFYITDFALLLHRLRKTSLYIGYMCLAMLLLFVRGINFFSLQYSMGLSYALLLPLLVLIGNVLEKTDLKQIIAALGTFFVILVFGSRGALLCVSSYLLFFTIKQKKWHILFMVLFLGVLLGLFFNLFAEEVIQYFAGKNIQTRSLQLFLKMSDNSVYLSGRDYLYAKTFVAIDKSPFAFKGMFASYMLNGIYPHNIILESVYDMGIFSILFFCVVLYAAFRSFNNNFTASSDIELILMSCSVSLLVSGSFWIEPYFWMWLILVLNSTGLKYTDMNCVVTLCN